uniref:Uncharacterized protein n=1 Tax=Cajanus cajan TaxID=3821 RepID=A0A151R1G4_CAJCA|nr:hypothetical protein KK1_042504 [Cajanus cajan]
MNRSFRAPESPMQAAFKQRHQQLGTLSSSPRLIDRDDELALFLEMRNREKEHYDSLLRAAEEADAAALGNSLFSVPSARKTGADDFLNSENDKNDYEWLLSPPGTPLFPSLEMETTKTVMSRLGAPTVRSTSLKARIFFVLLHCFILVSLWHSLFGLANPPSEHTGRRSNMVSKQTASSPGLTSSVPATKTTIPSRSSTPLSRSTARSSTPTTRPTLPASRSTSRSSTPTRRPSTPSNVPTVSAPSVKTSSISKSAPVMSRQAVPSSPGPSPTVKSRPWKPSEMPGFSLDAPPNLRTTLPERPLSTTRGRPGAPSPRSSSVDPAFSGRPRRQSCSPSRGRSSNGISHPTGSSMPAVNRTYSKANENVSPVVMGTKMVERMINMRKLAPPRLDNRNPSHNLSGKSSSSPDSSGFGRSLSKKSLDMAIRHMDIRRRVPGNIRPSMTNIPASSMYSVRSGPQRSRTVSISGSPHATSSNASSEVSVNQNGLCLDNSEIDDDIVSERGGQSPASVRGR